MSPTFLLFKNFALFVECVQIVWELMLAISYHTKNIIAAY